MDISRIDYWATSGTSVMHKATVYSKLAAALLVVATVVVTRDLSLLVCLYALVLITVRIAGLPVHKVLAISLYPGLFAVLFAVSQARLGWTVPAVIIMKALTSASAMVLLISTTPYTEVMGVFGRVLPRVVADGLFMTYRSFFILFGFLDHFLDALRLRGGFQPHRLMKNAGNMASGVGMLFIRAYDTSQRLYDVMTIRGYSGRLSGARPEAAFGPGDLPYPLMAGLFLAAALYAGPSGHPFNMGVMPLILAVYLAGMEVAKAWKR
jgi:cobalt/nickel transport system permease protein